MAGKRSKAVETQCLCCAVTDSGMNQAFSWAPSRKQPFQLQGKNFSLRSLYPSSSLMFYLVPRGNFIDIIWSFGHYGSESRNFVLRFPESMHTKKWQPPAALYKSLVETGRFLFWFSIDQPINFWLGIPTPLHAPPDNILSCSHCVQYRNWCDCVIQKFPVEAPVPLTYDKVSPALTDTLQFIWTMKCKAVNLFDQN